MDGVDSFLDREHSLLSESDAPCSKNWRMIGMIAVVGAKCLKVTLVDWLGHCRRKEVGVFIIWIRLRL